MSTSIFDGLPDAAPRESEVAFAEYVVRNYPPGTIISDPAWHAPRLLRAARHALYARPPLAAPPAQTTTAEDFCGVPHEYSYRETRSGTPYKIATWDCPSCGKKCSCLLLDDEHCHGDSFCIQHRDGKRTVMCGACWVIAAPPTAPADDPVIGAESVAKVVARLTDWQWLAEYANAGWLLPAKGTDALALLAGRAAAIMEKQSDELARLRADLHFWQTSSDGAIIQIEQRDAELARLRAELAASESQHRTIYEAEAEQLTRPYGDRAERAEAELADARALLVDARSYIDNGDGAEFACDLLARLDAAIDAARELAP